MMMQVEWREGQELAGKHLCAQCGAGLMVAWGGAYGIEGLVGRS